MTFTQIPAKKTLEAMIEEIQSQDLLKEDKQKIFHAKVYEDKDLIFKFMPSIEDIVDLAKRRNLHFLPVYLAIVYLKVMTFDHGNGKDNRENRMQTTSK